MPDERDHPPHPLDYGRPPARQGTRAWEVWLGFLTWELTVVATVWLADKVVGRPAWSKPSTAVLVLPLAAAVYTGVWLRVRQGRRGFLPGLLLGFGLTCLLPVGIVAVVCGSFR